LAENIEICGQLLLNFKARVWLYGLSGNIGVGHYLVCRYRFENNRVVEDISAEVDDSLIGNRRSSRGTTKSSFRQLRERQVHILNFPADKSTSQKDQVQCLLMMFSNHIVTSCPIFPEALICGCILLLINLISPRFVDFWLCSIYSAESPCAAIYGNRGCLESGCAS